MVYKGRRHESWWLKCSVLFHTRSTYTGFTFHYLPLPFTFSSPFCVISLLKRYFLRVCSNSYFLFLITWRHMESRFWRAYLLFTGTYTVPGCKGTVESSQGAPRLSSRPMIEWYGASACSVVKQCSRFKFFSTTNFGNGKASIHARHNFGQHFLNFYEVIASWVTLALDCIEVIASWTISSDDGLREGR